MTYVHFLHIACAVLTIVAVSWLNRVAGGGHILWPTGEEGDWLLKRWLPGKPVYWVSIAVFLIAWPWIGAQTAAALSFAAYLLWRLIEWGRWLTMGRLPIGWGRDGVAPSTYERCIETISFGSGRLAMFWRFLSTSPGIAPLAWLVEPTATNVATFMLGSTAALWLAYEAGWQGFDRGWWGRPFTGGGPAAERIAGGVWGTMIVALSFYHPVITGGGF